MVHQKEKKQKRDTSNTAMIYKLNEYITAYVCPIRRDIIIIHSRARKELHEYLTKSPPKKRNKNVHTPSENRANYARFISHQQGKWYHSLSQQFLLNSVFPSNTWCMLPLHLHLQDLYAFY